MKHFFIFVYAPKHNGTIIPAITISKQMIYNTFQTIGFGLTYRQAKIATITIIIAVAMPCKILTAVIKPDPPIADKINETAYKTVTATITQNEILFNPHTLLFEELEDELDDDFELELFFVAIFPS